MLEKASEILIDKVFGNRFPKGKDEDENKTAAKLASGISSTTKPYASNN